jgi:hypothetical protein
VVEDLHISEGRKLLLEVYCRKMSPFCVLANWTAFRLYRSNMSTVNPSHIVGSVPEEECLFPNCRAQKIAAVEMRAVFCLSGAIVK